MGKLLSPSLVLASLALAATAQSQVQFYFSTRGGDNSRLTTDTVTSSSWFAEYDIIIENLGGTARTFNAGSLLVGWGSATSEGPTAIDTSPNAISLFDPGSANNHVTGNPNIPYRASFFQGSNPCRVAGGRGAAGPARPYGFSIPIDLPLSTSHTISPGQKLFICTIKIKDSGLYALGGSRDLVLYDAGFGGSFTTGLFYGPDPALRAGVAVWESTSRLTLSGPASNQAPILAQIGNHTVDEDSPLSVTANASDPDFGQVLTFSLTGAPAGMTINSSSGVISWTPTETQGPGNYTFDVVVTDNGAPIASDSETITVTVNEVNVAPTWSIVPAQNTSEGASFSLNVAPFASDSDIPANTLSYSLVAGPAGLTVSSAGVVSWSPGESDGGTNPIVTVRASDNGTPNQTADVSFTISVAETNQPPVLTNPGTIPALEHSLLTYQLAGSDADVPAQMLTFAKISGPAGLSISSTGMLAWTPGESDGGSAPSVTVSLNDGTATVQTTFAVAVAEHNSPPVVQGVVDRYGVMGTLFWLVLDVTDPDIPANTITYSLGAGAPTGMTIDTSGLLRWVPTGAQVGLHTFNINVTDNGVPAATTTRTVTMRVGSEGRVEAWGDNSTSIVSLKPPGIYRAVSAGTFTGTALRTNGTLTSWGTQHQGLITATPTGPFHGVAVDRYFAVGLRTNGTLVGWGQNDQGTTSQVPTGTFVFADLGPTQGIAIRTNGQLAQWGQMGSPPPPPTGKFMAAAFGAYHGVAIRSDGTLASWGSNTNNVVSATPSGTFRGVTAGLNISVGIRSDGTLAAWGANTYGVVSNVPSGTFLAITSAGPTVLALRTDGSLVAWGYGAWGITAVPPGVFSGIGSGYFTLEAIRRNTPPVLNNPGPQAATEHAPFSRQLTATDAESSAASLVYGLVSGPTGLTVSTSGLVKWTPGEAFGGTSQNVTARVSDGIDTVTQTFSISVTEANGAPVCLNNDEDVSLGSTTDLYVLANDTDPEGNSFLVTSFTPPFPPFGTVSISNGGTTVQYAAPSNFFYRGKTTKFTYTVTDSFGASSSAQVTVKIK